MITCEKCKTVSGHAATCPTQLATPEQRIRYAAHIYTDQYPIDAWARCERLGISNDEFIAGIALKERQEEEYRSWTRIYGRQEYGGWARDERDGRYKPLEVIEAAKRRSAESVQRIEKAEAPTGGNWKWGKWEFPREFPREFRRKWGKWEFPREFRRPSWSRRKRPLQVEIARSFTYKLNVGNFESRDFFCSQKVECRMDEADRVAEQVHAFCKSQVLKAVNEFKAECAALAQAERLRVNERKAELQNKRLDSVRPDYALAQAERVSGLTSELQNKRLDSVRPDNGKESPF